jgi:hypothetical protein
MKEYTIDDLVKLVQEHEGSGYFDTDGFRAALEQDEDTMHTNTIRVTSNEWPDHLVIPVTRALRVFQGFLSKDSLTIKPEALGKLSTALYDASVHSVRISDVPPGENNRNSDILTPAARSRLKELRASEIAVIRAVCAGTHASEPLELLLGWVGEAERVLNDLDLQELGREMNMPLGSNVAKNVLPCIRALKREASNPFNSANLT